MRPSISAIVPTFDRAGLLPRALESVGAQTLPVEELIVVDDGSTDGTSRLVGERFPEARCLRQRRTGVSAARNRGILAARGEWIAFLDSDDQWLPHKLERQMAALADSPGHHICHSDEIWVRNGRRVNPRRRHAKPGGRIFRHCLPLCAVSPSCALVHRSVFDRIGLFDEALPACEDYDLWLRIAARYPVLLVDEPLVVKHGGHDDQLSRRTPGLDRYRIGALGKILESGRLEPEDRDAAIAVLAEKCRIWAGGAARRGRQEEADRYLELSRRWRRAARPRAPATP